MKKFTKICLITVGIMVIAGFAFVIAASVMAGGTAVILSELRSGNMNFGNWHFEDGVHYSNDGMKISVADIVEEALVTLPGGEEDTTARFSEEITCIEINTDSSNVTIKTTETEELTASLEDGYLVYYNAETSGDTLCIDYSTSAVNMEQSPKIIVEVPQEMMLEEIYVITSCGEIIVKDLKQELTEAVLHTDMGNVSIENCEKINFGTVHTSMGNIEIEDSHFGIVDMTTNMGNIEFSGRTDGDISGHADMGEVDVELDGKESDYNISLSTSMGTVTYEGVKQGNEASGSYTAYRDTASANISLSNSMGNVELSFEK